jgi:hypothetical protein
MGSGNVSIDLNQTGKPVSEAADSGRLIFVIHPVKKSRRSFHLVAKHPVKRSGRPFHLVITGKSKSCPVLEGL